MCGIVGYAPMAPEPSAHAAFGRLFRESTVRGLHAFGIAMSGDEGIKRWRRHATEAPPEVPAELLAAFDQTLPTIAHARYSTSGDWHVDENNQPIVVGQLALAFNGVISMGTKEEFEAEFDVACDSDNDGEVFLRRLAAGEAAIRFLARMTGSFAGVWLDGRQLLAATNGRRPLWRAEAYGGLWYASTRDIFARAQFPVEPVPVPPLTVERHV